MIYLITGASGQLGSDLKRELLSRTNAANIKTPSSRELDIIDSAAVAAYLEHTHPDVIFHCAAFTDVDAAESDPDICTKVNVKGTENIAIAAENIGAKLIYLSTDYIFAGNSSELYETNSLPSPQNVYGRTKLLGEQAVMKVARHFIVRTSWLFGLNGSNFVRAMLKLSETHSEIPVVDDQIGSPTYTRDLTKFLVALSDTEKYGIYHATNEGFCSRADFAAEIFHLLNRNAKIIPITTPGYEQIVSRPQAKRPLSSKLSKSSLTSNGFPLLPTWQDALARYLKELEQEGEL